jgi:hypothetical protein
MVWGMQIKVIRFGRPVERSFNRRDQSAEAGMSCYDFSEDGTVNLVGWYFGFTPRDAWVGVGDLVGQGSDGEPIVVNFRGRKISEAEKNQLLPAWADR